MIHLRTFPSLPLFLLSFYPALALAQNPAPAIPAPPPSAAKAPPAATATPAGIAPSTSPAPDPFIREKAPADQRPLPKEANPAASIEEPPKNILVTLETWSLKNEAFLDLLDASDHDGKKYSRLEALEKVGEAKLQKLIVIVAKSGQRASVQAVDEVRYAATFQPARRDGESPFPLSWSTELVGEVMIVESILGPDGKSIDVSLNPKSTRLTNFRDWQAEKSATPVSQPQFAAEQTTTAVSLQSGQPMFLSMVKKQDLIAVQVIRATAQAEPPAALEMHGDLARSELRVYSLPRPDARRLLQERANSAGSYSAIQALVAKGDAKLEIADSIVTNSGLRAAHEQLELVLHPTAYATPVMSFPPGAPAARQPASAASFEMQNVGLTFESELILGRYSTPQQKAIPQWVDISVIPKIVEDCGMFQSKGLAAQYPDQPVFTHRNISTTVNAPAGSMVLLGSLSQPAANGVNDRKDDERTSLAFIRVTPFKP